MGGFLTVIRAGRLAYGEALALQGELAAARAAGRAGDTLILLEHPPVITIGRAGGWEDILVSPARRRALGIDLHSSDRGGRATYHGPGQLVAYPILAIDPEEAYGHLWRLEETGIRLLAGMGLDAGRLEGCPGVWVAGRKIAAVGVAIAGGVTRHGLALNVCPDLAHFDLLIPCGLAGRAVTSVQRELGRPIAVDDLTEPFLEAFGNVFGHAISSDKPFSHWLPARQAHQA